EVVSLAGVGTLTDSVLDGSVAVRGRGVNFDAEGALDLGSNAFDGFETQLVLLDSERFGPGLTFREAAVRATFDGPSRRFSAPIELTVGEADLGGTGLRDLAERGTLTYDGTRWVLPLDASVARITSGNTLIDPRLVGGRLRGTLVLAGDRLTSDDLQLRFPGIDRKST